MSAAIERQSDLERAKAQLDLDWTHRCEDLERQQYERSEELVKGLTRSRDEVGDCPNWLRNALINPPCMIGWLIIGVLCHGNIYSHIREGTNL